jgi:hypothetical protein
MHLSYRTARPPELASHFEAMGEAFAYAADIRDKVPGVWARWLADGILTARVFERHARGRVSVEAFDAMVFLRDGVVEEFRGLRCPGLRDHVMRRALAGEEIALSPDAMRKANRSDGLTLLFLVDPRGRRGLAEQERALIDTKWSESLYELCGCRIKAIWHEVYGTGVMRHVAGCGLLVCEDWADYWAPHRPAPKPELRPYLLGVTREQSRSAPGTHASFLFNHVAPQFDFTVRQQELLHHALAGATDDDLAASLSVSTSAIKKRWISVYDRVGEAMPGWLETAAAGDARGLEKRRHLLNYLRQHPEELHPACASRD